MYYLKKDIDVEKLRDYGFKLGKEWSNYREFICNEPEYDDFWLVSTIKEDYGDEIYFAEEGIPLWYMQASLVKGAYRIWIDVAPAGTYHVDCYDMEPMLNVIYKLIQDGLIEDNYVPDEE